MRERPIRRTIVDTTILVSNRRTNIEVAILIGPLRTILEVATTCYLDQDQYNWALRPYHVTPSVQYYRILEDMRHDAEIRTSTERP